MGDDDPSNAALSPCRQGARALERMLERGSAPMTEATAQSVATHAPVTSRIVTWSVARRWPLVVWGAMLVWSVALFVTVKDDFDSFRLGRLDLGNMVQAVWSTAHGRPLESTVLMGDQIVRLASHIDPILVLFAPLWLVVPTPLLLSAVSIALMGLGALPVFWLGRRHLGSEKAAALIALAYLVYPWTAWAGRDAFHPVTLAIPLFLFAVWFLDGDRLWAFAICALFITATGELMGATIAALGIWYALARGRRRAGTTIAIAGVAWTCIAVYVLIPAFSDGPSVFYGYYGSIGGSPQGVLRTAVTDPGAIAAALFSSRDVLYLVWLALPLAGMFVLAPGLAAVALPQVFASTLSDNLAMTHPRNHYAAAVIPFLIAATVVGLGRLPAARRVFAATAVLALCTGFSLLLGPWPGAPGNTPSWDSSVVPSHHADALRAAVALVPDDAPVSSTNRAGSHMSDRRYVYSVSVVGRAEWIVLDTWDPFVANPGFPVLENNPEALGEFKLRIERSPSWRKVFDRDGVLVFRRVAAL